MVRTPQSDPVLPSTSKKPVFDLTLFLFGSGFALFIGVLAWADQIRGISRETNEIVSRFLTSIGVADAAFRRYQKARSASQQLIALSAVTSKARFSKAEQVDAIAEFKEWLGLVARLQKLNRKKYWLSFWLVVVLLGAGTVSLLAKTHTPVLSGILLGVPGFLLLGLLAVMFHGGRLEDQFLEMLDDLSAMA